MTGQFLFSKCKLTAVERNATALNLLSVFHTNYTKTKQTPQQINDWKIKDGG